MGGGGGGGGGDTPQDPHGTHGTPRDAWDSQARPSGSRGLRQSLRYRLAFRVAFASALLHFAFASLRFSLPFRFSNRTESNLEAQTPTGSAD